MEWSRWVPDRKTEWRSGTAPWLTAYAPTDPLDPGAYDLYIVEWHDHPGKYYLSHIPLESIRDCTAGPFTSLDAAKVAYLLEARR